MSDKQLEVMITLSKEKQDVICDAEAAGFTIIHRTGCVHIFQLSKHNKPRLLQGITIYEDGMAYRADVELQYATTIRSAQKMRKLLGLKERN